jgi:hypothetical protein
MSSKMIRAHGGSKNIVSAQRGEAIVLGGIVQNTMANTPKDVHMKGLDRLISQTTGIPREEPIMDGVIAATVPANRKDTPEISKVAKHEQGKTEAKRMGQVPYAGSKY